MLPSAQQIPQLLNATASGPSVQTRSAKDKTYGHRICNVVIMKTKYFYLSFGTAVISFLLLQSCVVKSKKVIAVRNFNGDKYFGKWYEIARFDYSFEKNMENTTAEYELNKDGSLKVINKGFNYKKNKWSSAKGKAKFTGPKTEATQAGASL